MSIIAAAQHAPQPPHYVTGSEAPIDTGQLDLGGTLSSFARQRELRIIVMPAGIILGLGLGTTRPIDIQPGSDLGGVYVLNYGRLYGKGGVGGVAYATETVAGNGGGGGAPNGERGPEVPGSSNLATAGTVEVAGVSGTPNTEPGSFAERDGFQGGDGGSALRVNASGVGNVAINNITGKIYGGGGGGGGSEDGMPAADGSLEGVAGNASTAHAGGSTGFWFIGTAQAICRVIAAGDVLGGGAT